MICRSIQDTLREKNEFNSKLLEVLAAEPKTGPSSDELGLHRDRLDHDKKIDAAKLELKEKQVAAEREVELAKIASAERVEMRRMELEAKMRQDQLEQMKMMMNFLSGAQKRARDDSPVE